MTVSVSILALIGPTASGKSELALALAERVGAEVLSVDSMQVYRGMDIGTAKPTAAELARAPHHGIDLVNPHEVFTVARFVEAADATIRDAARRGHPLIAAGGTPLYFRALFHGLFEGPGADAGLRERLASQDGHSLHARLAEVDPVAAERIHPNDTKRLVRALEVHTLTGQPISSLQVEWNGAAEPRHKTVWIGLSWEKEALNRRINARVKAMFMAGWVEEVRRLLAAPQGFSKTAAEATGYREIIRHLRGELAAEDAAEQVKIATRQLARKQMKWFRRFPNVHWLPGDAPLPDRVEQTLRLWQSAAT